MSFLSAKVNLFVFSSDQNVANNNLGNPEKGDLNGFNWFVKWSAKSEIWKYRLKIGFFSLKGVTVFL